MSTAIEKAKKVEKGPGLWRTFGGLPQLLDDLEHFWNPVPGFGSRRFPLFGTLKGQWIPRADVYEKDGEVVVSLDLPGLKKEEVEVRLEGGRLVIRGERKTESEVKEEDYYRMERSAGRFDRSMALSFEAKAEEIKADFKDGVLRIRIPKPAEAGPESRRIKVS